LRQEGTGLPKESEKMTEHTDSIKISKLTAWKVFAGVLFIVLLLSIYTGGFGLRSAPAVPSAAPAQAAQPAQPSPAAPSAPVDMVALMDDDTVKGDPDAPVTIVEWSDFECPFCTRFYEQTLGQVEEEYIKTGKVKMVYRDYPLGFHANAQKSAEAAECAGEQGKFWEMHDVLFEKGVSGGVSSFKQFAADLELDTAKFDECLDSDQMADEVKKDMADGQAAGISGTPGFVVNGQLIVGAQPFSAFKQIIDAELAK
jgi:protein-disulfide isomerase